MKIDVWQIATGVIALVLGAGVMWLIGSAGTGVDAVADARTKAIVAEMLVTDTGQTHGAALATINTLIIKIKIPNVGINGTINFAVSSLRS